MGLYFKPKKEKKLEPIITETKITKKGGKKKNGINKNK